LPSAAKPILNPEESRHEALALRLIQAQDLSMITRRSGDTSPLLEVLFTWLSQHQP
jgi:hypothetical protein